MTLLLRLYSAQVVAGRFFNVRAEKCYLKAGFKREGVLRDAVLNGDEYADDILMSILEDEWREIKNKRDIR